MCYIMGLLEHTNMENFHNTVVFINTSKYLFWYNVCIKKVKFYRLRPCLVRNPSILPESFANKHLTFKGNADWSSIINSDFDSELQALEDWEHGLWLMDQSDEK